MLTKNPKSFIINDGKGSKETAEETFDEKTVANP
jgi:hypothetical protein